MKPARNRRSSGPPRFSRRLALAAARRWHVAPRRAASVPLAVAGLEPLRRLNLLHQLLVDVRHDGLDEGVPDLLVFVGAARDPVLAQPLLDQVLERFRIAAIADAEKIVEALPGRRVHVPIGGAVLARKVEPDIG